MAFIQSTKEQAKDKVKELVQAFKENIEQYKLSTYKEAQVRKEFIDPLFSALGWDVSNEDKRAEQYKEVVNEDAIKISGNTKAPDYSFRIGGTRIFFVEAKKPAKALRYIYLLINGGLRYSLNNRRWVCRDEFRG